MGARLVYNFLYAVNEDFGMVMFVLLRCEFVRKGVFLNYLNYSRLLAGSPKNITSLKSTLLNPWYKDNYSTGTLLIVVLILKCVYCRNCTHYHNNQGKLDIRVLLYL